MPLENETDKRVTGPLPGIMDRLILRRKFFWILAFLIFALDLGSKSMVVDFVRENAGGRAYWIEEPWFALVEVTNKGGPWGLGGEYAEILRIVRLAALGVILFILVSTPLHYRFQTGSLALVMGGAMGNIWDSWKFGYVRDFLYFDLGFPPADPWPAFNLADSMICVGVAGLAISMIFSGRKPVSDKTACPQNEPVD
ncbi:MAG: signal peptidase II [Planctomycetes bacterium]|nr:signal peptidase II [Planctomycetota bacterium]